MMFALALTLATGEQHVVSPDLSRTHCLWALDAYTWRQGSLTPPASRIGRQLTFFEVAGGQFACILED